MAFKASKVHTYFPVETKKNCIIFKAAISGQISNWKVNPPFTDVFIIHIVLDLFKLLLKIKNVA